MGQKGDDGGNIESMTDMGNAFEPGDGGLPGTPGNGGKIFVVTIDMTAGQVFQAKIGLGGAGETYTYHYEDPDTGNVIDSTSPAQPGTASQFGPYSSDNGYQSDVGYVPLIGGNVYATPGPQGVAGGRGASADEPGENVVWNGVTYVPGAQGETIEGSAGTAYGGYGGGPAAGSNGGDGRRGGGSNNDETIHGGQGGDGAIATAVPPVPSVRGSGGAAGNGGGGAGATARPYYFWRYEIGHGGLG